MKRLLDVLLNPWFLAFLTLTLLLLVSLELIGLRDEAIWSYSAWLWAVHDAPPYVGSFENKPAAIFLLYRLSYALFGLNIWPVRLLAAFSLTATGLIVYATARRYLNREAGGVASLVFGLAMAHYMTEGNILVVSESFMIFFTAIAFFIISSIYLNGIPIDRSISNATRATIGRQVFTGKPPIRHCITLLNINKHRWLTMLGLGAAWGAALSFKQIALADIVGLAPLYWLAVRPSATPRKIVADVFWITFAAIFVTGLCFLPLWLSGVTFQDYFNGVWRILFSQTQSLTFVQRLKLICGAWLHPAVTPFYPLVLLFLFQKKPLQKSGVPFWCLLFWFATTFIGANASNVYHHQLKQIMLPLSIMAGLSLGVLVKPSTDFAPRWLLYAVIAIFLVLAPYKSVATGLAQILVPQSMHSYDADEVRTHRQLAKLIDSHTSPSDSIYIWAINSHPIHLYSQRRSSCRYFNAIFRFAPDFEHQTLTDLADRPPQLILVQAPTELLPEEPPPFLKQLLDKKYQRFCQIDDFEVFKRAEDIRP